MKLWKKAAAAVLAAVMSLTLLTGCSGSAKITRDSEKEKQATDGFRHMPRNLLRQTV